MVRADLELRPCLLAALWLAMVTSGCASLAAPEEWGAGNAAGVGGIGVGAHGGGGAGPGPASSSSGGAASAGGSGGGPGAGGSGGFGGGAGGGCRSAGDWVVYVSDDMQRCYGVHSMAHERQDAYAACQSLFGGDLAALTTAGEQDEIAAYLSDKYDALQEFWIGLSGEPISDTWKWTTGEVYRYSAWGQNQPTLQAEENCVMTDGGLGWSWNNIDCTLTKQPLCERPIVF
jgi:hypothetical protein